MLSHGVSAVRLRTHIPDQFTESELAKILYKIILFRWHFPLIYSVSDLFVHISYLWTGSEGFVHEILIR
ncbi:MAG: hypothetical protein AAE977_06715 [Thermoplasmataceae archaeon]